MKIIETKVYTFDELSDSAKEKAREWYRNNCLDYEWFDLIYDDAKSIGLKLTTFGLDRDRHAEGVFTNGALECANAIESQHGESCETFKTAKAFLAARGGIVDAAKLDDCETQFLASILEDYAIILQKEFEYLLSDESVDNIILTNEYTFTESGKRF